ncbi:TPA: hypothetical protein ACF3MX_004113, partial [Enterobacter hormaechei]
RVISELFFIQPVGIFSSPAKSSPHSHPLPVLMLPLMLQFWMKISLTSMKTKFAEKSYLYIDSLYHNSSLGVIADDNDDLFVRKWLLHRDVLMCLMKTLLTSRCINQRGAGHRAAYPEDKFLFQ